MFNSQGLATKHYKLTTKHYSHETLRGCFA